MNTEKIINDVIGNLERKKSVVYSTDKKIPTLELNELKKVLKKSIKEAIKNQKNKISISDIMLDSRENVDEFQLEEGVNRLLTEGELLDNESNIIITESLKKFDEYLIKRNFSKEDKEELKKEYLKYGITDELKENIISGIVEYLQKNNYDRQTIEMSKNVVEEEIQKMKENEFNINFDDFVEKYYKPKRTQHKNLSSVPIIQVQNYPATVEGLKKFGNDYGIKEELINDLFSNSNKDEVLNKIADELENNHMFLGTDEENKIIKQFFIEDMKEKITQINENRVVKPIEALDMIYSELGFNDEEKRTFLNNAKEKGTPGKDFYKKVFNKLDVEQKEMYKKIESLTETVGVKKRKKVKMVKYLSPESKEVIKEDYRDLIRRRQQIFENMYNLNHMVKQGVNENVVSAKNYKIIDVKPAKNSITLNKVKKATIKAQMNLRDRIKNFLFNNNIDLNLAVGDFVKIKDEVLPVLALKVDDFISTSKNTSIKNIMKENNLSEAKLAFAVSSNNNTFDFHPYSYDSIEEIYKNNEENEKVK